MRLFSLLFLSAGLSGNHLSNNDIFLYNQDVSVTGTMVTKQGIHKSRGGLIRAFVTEENSIIKDITISGDFFMFPEEALFIILEKLKGTIANREALLRNIEETYKKEKIQSPGTLPSDFAESIMKALES